MSDKRAQTYDLYLAAWSAVPDAERARMLRKSLSECTIGQDRKFSPASPLSPFRTLLN
jgi:hypothetical protein